MIQFQIYFFATIVLFSQSVSILNFFLHFFPYVVILVSIKPNFHLLLRQRPYHVEYTGSRPITEVKQRWARLVLGWVTAWEHRVLLALFFPSTHSIVLH